MAVDKSLMLITPAAVRNITACIITFYADSNMWIAIWRSQISVNLLNCIDFLLFWLFINKTLQELTHWSIICILVRSNYCLFRTYIIPLSPSWLWSWNLCNCKWYLVSGLPTRLLHGHKQVNFLHLLHCP